MTLSLRRRLLIGTALGTGAVLLAAGLGLYQWMRGSLLAAFDAALREKAATLAELMEQEGDRVDLEFAEVELPEFTRSQSPEYFEVWDAAGAVVALSPSLRGGQLPRPGDEPRTPTVQPCVLPDGRPGRMVYLSVVPRPDPEFESTAPPGRVTLALARGVREVQAALASLRTALWGVGLLATLSSVVVLAVLVRAGLRPAAGLADAIAQLDERRMTARIASERLPVELLPIALRLNELLERLEQALLREIAMTANVAHELRTPLAGLRSTLEVALARPRDTSAYQEALDACLRIALQTQAMAENLLALARLDSGADGAPAAPTDLAALIDSTWETVAVRARKRGLRFDCQLQRPLERTTDAAKLGLVLRNLFENAVEYADAGGTVTIRGERRGAAVYLHVANSGSQISASQAARVFDRFWRGDAARHASAAHSGLGLALARSLIELLGGTITAESVAGGEFRVALTL